MAAFRDAVVTSLANPKLSVFFVALFPQFVPDGGAGAAVTRAQRALRAPVGAAARARDRDVLVALGLRLALGEPDRRVTAPAGRVSPSWRRYGRRAATRRRSGASPPSRGSCCPFLRGGGTILDEARAPLPEGHVQEIPGHGDLFWRDTGPPPGAAAPRGRSCCCTAGWSRPTPTGSAPGACSRSTAGG